jgi:hypothetical protein
MARSGYWALLAALLVAGWVWASSGLFKTDPLEQSTVALHGTHLELRDDHWLLSGRVEFKLSQALTQLLNAGLPLHWTLEVRQQTSLVSDWFFVTREQSTYDYKIRFDAISQTYVIENRTLNRRLEFKSLDEALSVMGFYDQLEVAKNLHTERPTRLNLAFRIQPHHWPLPLQISALLNRAYAFDMRPLALYLPAQRRAPTGENS